MKDFSKQKLIRIISIILTTVVLITNSLTVYSMNATHHTEKQRSDIAEVLQSEAFAVHLKDTIEVLSGNSKRVSKSNDLRNNGVVLCSVKSGDDGGNYSDSAQSTQSDKTSDTNQRANIITYNTTCSSTCGSTCDFTCYTTCSSTCDSTCYTTCSSTCGSTCSNCLQ